jgi:hypothetical protein
VRLRRCVDDPDSGSYGKNSCENILSYSANAHGYVVVWKSERSSLQSTVQICDSSLMFGAVGSRGW